MTMGRCFAVTGETDSRTGDITILKSVRPPMGFVRRSEQSSPDEDLFRKLSLPLLVALSGGMLFCGILCTLLLSLRCALDGYILCSFFRAAQERDAVFVIVFLIVSVIEALSVLSVNSMAFMAQRFMKKAKNGVTGKTVLRYAAGQFFYTGLIFVLYLIRGTAVLLFGG